MHYQGHLSDGSSVQRHSAGGLYPYVMFAQQTEGGLKWGFIHPNGLEFPACTSYDRAAEIAAKCKGRRDLRRVLQMAAITE